MRKVFRPSSFSFAGFFVSSIFFVFLSSPSLLLPSVSVSSFSSFFHVFFPLSKDIRDKDVIESFVYAEAHQQRDKDADKIIEKREAIPHIVQVRPILKVLPLVTKKEKVIRENNDDDSDNDDDFNIDKHTERTTRDRGKEGSYSQDSKRSLSSKEIKDKSMQSRETVHHNENNKVYLSLTNTNSFETFHFDSNLHYIQDDSVQKNNLQDSKLQDNSLGTNLNSKQEISGEKETLIIDKPYDHHYNEMKVYFSLEVDTTTEFSQDPISKDISLQVQVDRHQVKPFSFHPFSLSEKEKVNALQEDLLLYCHVFGLSDRNCHHILDAALSIIENINCPIPHVCEEEGIKRQVCVTITESRIRVGKEEEKKESETDEQEIRGETEEVFQESKEIIFDQCQDLDKWQSLYFLPRPGFYLISMELVGNFPGRKLLLRDSATIQVVPQSCLYQFQIISPQHGASVLITKSGNDLVRLHRIHLPPTSTLSSSDITVLLDKKKEKTNRNEDESGNDNFDENVNGNVDEDRNEKEEERGQLVEIDLEFFITFQIQHLLPHYRPQYEQQPKYQYEEETQHVKSHQNNEEDNRGSQEQINLPLHQICAQLRIEPILMVDYEKDDAKKQTEEQQPPSSFMYKHCVDYEKYDNISFTTETQTFDMHFLVEHMKIRKKFFPLSSSSFFSSPSLRISYQLYPVLKEESVYGSDSNLTSFPIVCPSKVVEIETSFPNEKDTADQCLHDDFYKYKEEKDKEKENESEEEQQKEQEMQKGKENIPTNTAIPHRNSNKDKGKGKHLKIITGASQLYIDEGRLQNLIGSIQFWEPTLFIYIYDLGLNPQSRELIQGWSQVTLLDLPWESLPSHVSDPTTYASKPEVWLHALEKFHLDSLSNDKRSDKELTSKSRSKSNAPNSPILLWLDANIELRRPLDEVYRLILHQGYFLTIQEYRFPTSQFHHPSCLEQTGCDLTQTPEFSRQHASTAFIGMIPGGWWHREVLPRVLNCSRNPTCINPPGSSRANHRQDQSVVNGVLCALQTSPTLCHEELKWRLSSDLEYDDNELQPTLDEQQWNDLIFYVRRNFPVKPYLKYLRKRERDEKSEMKENELKNIEKEGK